MTLIWTTTMPPFSSWPYAWLPSLNTTLGKIIHTLEYPIPPKHTHMLAINWSHVNISRIRIDAEKCTKIDVLNIVNVSANERTQTYNTAPVWSN